MKRHPARRTKHAAHAPLDRPLHVAPPDADRRRIMVLQAMEALRLGGRPSRKSGAWRLDTDVLFEAACARLIDNTPSETVCAELAEKMRAAKVHHRAMVRWLVALRDEYRRLIFRATEAAAADATVAAAGTDLNHLANVVTQRMAARLLAALQDDATFASLSNNERHLLQRMYEGLIAAAKATADARHKDAQTEKIRDAIETRIAEINGSRRKRAYSKHEAIGMLRSLLLGNEPEEAAA